MTFPRWRQTSNPAPAGRHEVEPASSLALDRFYLTMQAALDGLGVAMGPTALVADELEAGRLVAPFAAISLPTRNYHAYTPDSQASDPSARACCDWLEEAGRQGNGVDCEHGRTRGA